MKAYHGTTKGSWNTDKNEPGTLYLTIDRDEAVSYAEEQSEREACDLPEAEWSSIELVVVEFDIDDLKALAESDEEVELAPDFGWEDGFADGAEPTWEESRDAVGSFAVSGFLDRHKTLGAVTAAYDPETAAVPGMR